MDEKQNDGKRAYTLNVKSLTRLRHHNPTVCGYYFHFFAFHFFFCCCCCFVCSVDIELKKGAQVKEHANHSLAALLGLAEHSQCYWYAESQPLFVSHNHSEYFMNISDHSGRFTDSLFFRSLRWIDVSHRPGQPASQQKQRTEPRSLFNNTIVHCPIDTINRHNKWSTVNENITENQFHCVHTFLCVHSKIW